MKRIYLDYASLTPIDPRVLTEIKKYSADSYANPSSLYKEGVQASTILKENRQTIATFLHSGSEEIFFTSGGTESNCLALEGTARAAHRNGIKKPHLIISNIEHSSIMEMASMMEKNDVEVTRLPVDKNGLVSLKELKESLRAETFLVSIMYVNNEIGSIQPIRDIAKTIRAFRENNSHSVYPLFHTDAAQAPLYLEMNVHKLGVDLLTLDGGKIYGPRGIGCLYVKNNTPIEPIIYGGGQEKGLRSGTENIPTIAGFAKAVDLIGNSEEEFQRIRELKSYFIAELKKIKSDIYLNGHDENSPDSYAPHIVSVSIPGINNEFFLFQLDAKGIAISTKSSCLRDEDESYVLKAIGADNRTSLRFSFGRWTTRSNVKKALKVIKKVLGV